MSDRDGQREGAVARVRTGPQARGRAGHRGAILAGLMLTMGLAAMDGTIVATAIPSIVRDLGGFALFPWVFSIYLLAQAATIPVYGKLADLYGRKPVLLFGAGLFLLGSMLSGLSWSMPALIVFRGLQGIGAGAVQPITMTVVGDLYTVEERARIQGYISSVWGISAIVGPALGGFLVQFASWHWIFYINVPVGAGALAAIGLYLHERLERRPHRIDYAGSALLVASMILLNLDLLEGGVGWSWTSAVALGLLAASAVLLGVFVWHERRAAEPVLPLWVMSRRLLLTANLGSMVVGVLTIALSSFLPTFVQGVLRGTPLVAGFALGMMSLGWPLASAFSGRLYLRIGFRTTALVGSLLTAGASLAFAALGPASTPVEAGAASFLMGLGMGLMSTSLLVAIQSAVDWNRRGVVTGGNMFMRMLGSALGAAVFGGILNGALARRLAAAPAAVRPDLPRGLNAASLALGNVPVAQAAAEAFVRDALYVAVHAVFAGLIFVAALGLVAVLCMPVREERLAAE